MRIYRIILTMAIIMGICCLSEAATIPLDIAYELPVNPNGKKVKKKKSKRQCLWGNSNSESSLKMRRWGLVSALLGGYLIIFSILGTLFLIGLNIAWYTFFLFALPIIPALMLLISGIQLIDRSYIYYSEHPSLKKERLGPLIWRDFIFSFILILPMIPMLWIGFYVTATLLLLAILVLLIMAFMKVGTYKKL